MTMEELVKYQDMLDYMLIEKESSYDMDEFQVWSHARSSTEANMDTAKQYKEEAPDEPDAHYPWMSRIDLSYVIESLYDVFEEWATDCVHEVVDSNTMTATELFKALQEHKDEHYDPVRGHLLEKLEQNLKGDGYGEERVVMILPSLVDEAMQHIYVMCAEFPEKAFKDIYEDVE